MWISRQIVKGSDDVTIESGRSISGTEQGVDMVSTGVERNVDVFSPYGYSFSLPGGEGVLTARNADGQAIIGINMKDTRLKQGEIKIVSKSGAYVYLKADGSVEINGLIINKNGVVE